MLNIILYVHHDSIGNLLKYSSFLSVMSFNLAIKIVQTETKESLSVSLAPLQLFLWILFITKFFNFSIPFTILLHSGFTLAYFTEIIHYFCISFLPYYIFYFPCFLRNTQYFQWSILWKMLAFVLFCLFVNCL